MGIMSSLFTGVSGLNANGTALSVIGNNIANMSTVGFKSSKASFADLISSSISGGSGAIQTGIGVALTAVQGNFSQGSLSTSGNVLDMAIDGNGFFEVHDNQGATFYSRAGSFRLDKLNNVVDPTGLKLQGFLADTQGVITGSMGDIALPSTTASPKATVVGFLAANLNSSTPITGVKGALLASAAPSGLPTAAGNNSFQLNLNGDGVQTVTVANGLSGAGLATAIQNAVRALVPNDPFRAAAYGGFTASVNAAGIFSFASGMTGATNNTTASTGTVVVTAPAGNTLAASLNMMGKLVGGGANSVTYPYTPGAGDQSFDIDLNDGNGVQTITLAGGPYANDAALAPVIQAAVRAQAIASTASAGFTATAAAGVFTFTSGAGGATTVTQTTGDTLALELKLTAAFTPTSTAATSTTGTDFNITNPTGTSNFSTSMSVYDSLGNDHLLTTYFTNTGNNTWNYNILANINDVVTANYNAANIDATLGAVRVGAGTLTFSTNGTLERESVALQFDGGTAAGVSGTTPGQLQIDWNGATPDQQIIYNFGTSVITDGGTGLDGTTQFGSKNAVVQQTQDGYAAGALQAFSIDSNGVINGRFSNGQLRALAQVILARFPDPLGLTRTGNNTFAESGNSGQPIRGVPESAGLGKLKSNSLELSNVDLGESFIDMIAAQRGFQANSRVITTSDEILQELVNIKR